MFAFFLQTTGSVGQKGEFQLKKDLLEDCSGEAKDQNEVENKPFTGNYSD